MLKDWVSPDAYVAYCLAAAYASVDEVEEEDYYAESLEFLEQSIEWGFRNVQILETTSFFSPTYGSTREGEVQEQVRGRSSRG